MSKNLLIQGKTMSAPVKGMLAAEHFLNENYFLRRNVLNGKVEFAIKPSDGGELSFLPLTQLVLNSMILRAKRENICDGASPKPDIMEYVNSAEVSSFDPIRDYLDHLPAWDGQNHVSQLFNRLPGVTSEQLSFLSIWLRSTVAHWLQMDTLHGNECVPTLIGC